MGAAPSQSVDTSAQTVVRSWARRAGLTHSRIIPISNGRLVLLLGENHTIGDSAAHGVRLVRQLVQRCDTRVDVLLEATPHSNLYRKGALTRGDDSGSTSSGGSYSSGDDSDERKGEGDVAMAEDPADATLASLIRFSTSTQSASCDKVRFVYTDMRDGGAMNRGFEELQLWKSVHTDGMSVTRRQQAYLHVRYTYEGLTLLTFMLRKLLKCQFQHASSGSAARRVVSGVRQSLHHRASLARRMMASLQEKRGTVAAVAFQDVLLTLLITLQECTDLFSIAQLYRDVGRWAPVIAFVGGAAHTRFLEEMLPVVQAAVQGGGRVRLPPHGNYLRELMRRAMGTLVRP